MAALAAFAAWCFVSLLWADARGDAWDAANRALLYATVFALFAVLPWGRRDAVVLLEAFVLATVIAGVVTLGEAIGGGNEVAFRSGRLAGPIGYENASAALFAIAFWPALALAARRSAPPWARGLLLAASGVLAALIVLTQSRGSLVAAIAGAVAAIVLTPERGRLLAALGAVAAVTAAGLPVLARVYVTGPDGRAGPLVAAAVAIAAAAALLLAAGIASARLDARFRGGRGPPARAPLDRRWASSSRSAPRCGARVSTPVSRRAPARAATTSGRCRPSSCSSTRCRAPEPATSRMTTPASGTAGSSRCIPIASYGALWGKLDLWALSCSPGSSSPASAPASEGARRSGRSRAAALAGAAAWLAQASIDWLWELPAVTAPAIAMLGVAPRLVATARPPCGCPPHGGSGSPPWRRSPPPRTRCRRSPPARSSSPSATTTPAGWTAREG